MQQTISERTIEYGISRWTKIANDRNKSGLQKCFVPFVFVFAQFCECVICLWYKSVIYLWVDCFFASSGDSVETDESVEARGSSSNDALEAIRKEATRTRPVVFF